jgi:hypothetical protein
VQAAIDACAGAGGGVVYFPPGAYTVGTLRLRSHLRIVLEAGATVYSSKQPAHFTERALFYGEDLVDITLEGAGTVDGQATYAWRPNDMEDRYIYPHQVLMERKDLSLERSFPTADSVGHLVLLVRCTDVRILGLRFLHSPSWTMHLWGCERVRIDGVYIYTSQRDGVWADGIDPDGCKDLHISNCTIETGDDALVFYSSSIFGPARPCENITVTNCRLSSASSALKFCDGNLNAIRNVVIDNCVITGSNRGVAFMVFDGGVVSDVVLTNLVIECRRFDWFWWGEADPIHFNLIRRSEIDPHVEKGTEPPVGTIRNVLIQNVFARGAGPSIVRGHPDSWLENITLQNVRLALADDPHSPLEKAAHVLSVERVRNLRLKDVELVWETPVSEVARGALSIDGAQRVTLDGLGASAASGSRAAAVEMRDVSGAVVRNCRSHGPAGVFLYVAGEASRDIIVRDNDLPDLEARIQVDSAVQGGVEVRP